MSKQAKPAINKEYYTTKELAEMPWFPVNSMATVQKLVERGRLQGVNVSSNPSKYKRYRITRDSVLKFLFGDEPTPKKKKKATKK